MVRIKDIALDIGVTVTTVSNALSGKGRVSEDLADRIRRRASELGYRPNQAGRALQSGRTGILGLVVADLTNPVFPQIARSLSRAADDKKLGILIGDSRASEEEQCQALSRLVDLGVDGLVVVPQKGTTPPEQPVPMVIVNTPSDLNNTVSADHRQGGELIATHIRDLGHRNVLLVGADEVSEVQKDRIAGMLAALEPGIQTEIRWGIPEECVLQEAIAAGTTAILATSDLLALRLHSQLLKAGLCVPDDVSLTGFDDLVLATALHPPLTTVAQNAEEIAQRALEEISKMIAGETAAADGHAVPMRLVVRQSTSQPKSLPREGNSDENCTISSCDPLRSDSRRTCSG